MRHPHALLFLLALTLACGTEPQTQDDPVPTSPPPHETPAPPSAEIVEEEAEEEEEESYNYCTTDKHLALSSAAILQQGTKPANEAPRPKGTATSPAWLDRITERFALSDAERSHALKHGAVVSDKGTTETFAHLYHEIYQSQLPIFVTLDSIFHTVFISHKAIVASVEHNTLSPRLAVALEKMLKTLPEAANDYPDETGKDLALYLGVAKALLDNTKEAEGSPHADVLGRVLAADTMVPIKMFGRQRMVDFTRFKPRGHYTDRDGLLVPYFRAAMWLSRLEFNVVSRSCRSSHPAAMQTDPRETPREAIAALALADLASRSGAMDDLMAIDDFWGALAGPREDISLPDLLTLRDKAGITDLKASDTAAALKAAIGDGWQRSTNNQYMPGKTTTLPAVSAPLGPRITADAQAYGPLIHNKTQGRYLIGPGDVGFVLGHDHALGLMTKDLRNHKNLETQLHISRATIEAQSKRDDLYNIWLRAVRAVSAPVEGTRPALMDKPQYRDMRLNTALAAYGQLRHNNVLMATETYDLAGCEIPDGYVEPAPAVYAALLDWQTRFRATLAMIDPDDRAATREWFERTAMILTTLKTLGERQLAGLPPTTEGVSFMGAVAEIGISSGGEPEHNGWYFKLFYEGPEDEMYGEHPGLDGADFVADVQTSTNMGKVAHIGAKHPRLGVFIVNTNGTPRAMVGPVARAYWATSRQSKRLTNETAKKLTAVHEPWAASFTIANNKPVVPIAIRPSIESTDYDHESLVLDVDAASATTARFILFDHNRGHLGEVTVKLKPGMNRVAFPPYRPLTEEEDEMGMYIQAELLLIEMDGRAFSFHSLFENFVGEIGGKAPLE